MITRLWTDETGQGLPEYAMLVAAVVVLVVSLFILSTDQIARFFGNIDEYINTEGPLSR
jgi:Flp pilus assembly pilin Flp